jgi:hypothetical protein
MYALLSKLLFSLSTAVASTKFAARLVLVLVWSLLYLSSSGRNCKNQLEEMVALANSYILLLSLPTDSLVLRAQWLIWT